MGRSELTKAKQHSHRVHLPGPIDRSQDRPNDAHEAPSTVDLALILLVQGQSEGLGPLDLPPFPDSLGQVVDVDAGDEEQKRGRDGRADYAAYGADSCLSDWRRRVDV
jgi:hypothetical protein